MRKSTAKKGIRKVLLCLAVSSLILGGCKKKEEPANEPAPTEEAVEEEPKEEEPEIIKPELPSQEEEIIPEGKVKSYLTGEYVDEAIGKRRPIAVMLNNIQAAIPQAGIANAGVIYEAPVEGGITRLMAVIEDYDTLEKLGSMRSCRNYYIFYASGFDAIYVHYGQSPYALPVLDLPEVNNLSGLASYTDSVFYRTSDRKAPHNAYTSFAGIQKGIELCGYRKDYTEDYEGSYAFCKVGDTVELPGNWSAQIVNPGYQYNKPWFEYHEEDGLYYRYQYGSSQIDELTQQQLTCKNILIQYSSWKNYDENGYLNIDVDEPNEGIYITNGKAIPVSWKKHEPWGPTYYYDSNGNEITLNTGKTWVCIVQDSYRDLVSVTDREGFTAPMGQEAMSPHADDAASADTDY